MGKNIFSTVKVCLGLIRNWDIQSSSLNQILSKKRKRERKIKKFVVCWPKWNWLFGKAWKGHSNEEVLY